MEPFIQCDEIRPRVDRVSYIRTIRLERTCSSEADGGNPTAGAMGLSLNVSSRGLCLLLDRVPAMGEVMRVHMPMPVTTAQTPTLADVRWMRSITFHGKELVIVGLQFLV